MSSSPNWGLGAHPRLEPDIVDALPCRGCGRHTLSILEIQSAKTGEVAFWIYLCRPCQRRQEEDLAPRRRLFDQLLADGMSSDLANRVMVAWFR